MANFQETRFLGLTPRAMGLSAVAIAIVVGLFFIPEAVKLLIEAKPKIVSETTRRTDSAVKDSGAGRVDSGARAALSPNALNALNTDMINTKRRPLDGTGERQRDSNKGIEVEETSSGKKGGIFSGWDFSIKAGSDGGRKIEAPASLSFEKIVSREGASFFKQGRGAIPRFLKQEGLLQGPAKEGIEPLQDIINVIVAGGGKTVVNEEISSKLRSAHVAAIRGLRQAGADRGVMLRWLELPIIRFIDVKGGVRIAQRIQDAFDPGFILGDLSVRQRKQRGWGGNGRTPTSFRADFSVFGTDVEKVVAYLNGRLVRTFKVQRSRLGEPSPVRINGDAAGVWTFVVHDKFGSRPHSKSYSFYPRVSIFRQSRDGVFQIGFLPGSSHNSLDKFFLVGSSTRRQPSNSMLATF